MRALEEDKYVRQIEGYLPSATVAFIDEIFKANSAILNTLLTILNERLFDNGSSRIQVPLICLVRITSLLLANAGRIMFFLWAARSFRFTAHFTLPLTGVSE
jgi:MoxR-like ATPase